MQATPNYQRSIHVSTTPQQAYQALTTGYAHWWTSPDKPLEKVGDIAKFSFAEKNGYWTFKANILEPDHIELSCVEALHIHDGMPKTIETEWLGTTLIWHILATDEGCRIDFEHLGLAPHLHCYAICERGWDMFFVDSLKAYLDTGLGKPFSNDA